MSETSASLRRKISSATDLRSVVRTMKALAASSIGQYEESARSLARYYRTVEMGLGACFRDGGSSPSIGRATGKASAGAVVVVVFGSDQGLVGQFNEVVVGFAVQKLSALPAGPAIWAVGERVHASLSDAGLAPGSLFAVPNSIEAITSLIGQILEECETHRVQTGGTELHLFYNRPESCAVYAPVHQRLLPLDESWMNSLSKLPWPTRNAPQMMGDRTVAMRALVREYLFASLFRACAESLASENATRLAAMQRADRNIDELLENLGGTFHRLRQDGIDEELFDVISGFVASGG